MSNITPFLWFNDNAEEAMNFYLSVFKNAKAGEVTRYGEGGHRPAGSFMTGSFELEGQKFMVLNGGPHYQISPGISFFVTVKGQSEVDRYWEKLTEGGQAHQCGWVTDRFGVTWQIVPEGLHDLLHGAEPEKAKRAWDALMQQVKIDMHAIERAYHGEAVAR